MPEPTITPDPEQAAELDAAAHRAPLNERDQVPGWVLRGQQIFHDLLSNQSRLLLGMVIVVLAVVAAIVLSSSRVLRILFDALDIVAFVGLFLVNWIGNGGVLVPIPGARFIGLLMVFQQAVILPSWEVFAVAGAAMGLGLASYYVAGARTAKSYEEGDTEGAEQLAARTGMLDEQGAEFSPGAELDAKAVSAIAGVQTEMADDVAAPADGPDVVAPGADAVAGADATSGAEAAASSGSDSTRGRMRRRFRSSLQRAQDRAQPVIEQRGAYGMFVLCFAPTPMATAAAYLGGLLRFGFTRYLVSSFAAKYLLTGIIVILALMFSDVARAVDIPELEIPIIDVTLFEDDPIPGPSPSPSASPAG